MDVINSHSLHAHKESHHSPIWKGLFLTILVACASFLLSRLPILSFVSPMMIAVVVGATYKAIFGVPTAFQKGITFSTQKLLKVAIIILGLQLSIAQLLAIGWNGLLIIFLTLSSTFLFSLLVGKWLGIDTKLTRLIAAGTSICGASAIMATNSVIKAKDEYVAYAITIVSIFGFLSMLLFPLVGNYLQLAPATFGFWSGASIHDTAQVIGTSFQAGEESSQVAIVSKLSRVLFLIPVILMLSLASGKNTTTTEGTTKHRSYMPWFVLGFIGLVIINSIVTIDPTVKNSIKLGNKFLLTIALAAMGLQIHFTKIKASGCRPLILGAMAWIYISSIGLILTKTMGVELK